MARPKGKPKMPATAEFKTKPVRVDLPPDVHDLLRLVAAYRRVSMAAVAREFVERMVRDEAKERGIR